HLFEGLADDKGIEAKSVLVNAAVLEGERRRLAVGDHDDLTHVFFLAEEDALGHAQAFARVGVIRADLNAREFAKGNFFGRIMKKNQAESVAGILRPN